MYIRIKGGEDFARKMRRKVREKNKKKKKKKRKTSSFETTRDKFVKRESLEVSRVSDEAR